MSSRRRTQHRVDEDSDSEEENLELPIGSGKGTARGVEKIDGRKYFQDAKRKGWRLIMRNIAFNVSSFCKKIKQSINADAIETSKYLVPLNWRRHRLLGRSSKYVVGVLRSVISGANKFGQCVGGSQSSHFVKSKVFLFRKVIF